MDVESLSSVAKDTREEEHWSYVGNLRPNRTFKYICIAPNIPRAVITGDDNAVLQGLA